MAWPEFDLQLHGPSNNAPQQNQAAQQQIQQNTGQAQALLKQWIAQNPFPLNSASAPGQAPQFGGQQFGGGMFGGANGGPMQQPKPPGQMQPLPGQPSPITTGMGFPGGEPRMAEPPAMQSGQQQALRGLPPGVRPGSGVGQGMQGSGIPIGLLAILQGRGLA